MIQIRSARLDDAEPIAGVHVATWRTAYAGMLPDHVLLGLSSDAEYRYWRHAIAARQRDCSVYVAADEDSEILGYGSAGPARSNGLPFADEIYTLYVAPDHQGKVLGCGLLHGLFGALHHHGNQSAILWVLAANPARFFYRAMGGTLVAERRERYFGALLDELAYGWADLKNLADAHETAPFGQAHDNG